MQIISKSTHNVLLKTGAKIVTLTENSVVVLDIALNDIEKILHEGTSVIVVLKNGERIIIENFFKENSDNDLVFKDDNQLYLAEFSPDNVFIRYDLLNDIEPLLYHTPSDILPWVGGVAGVGILAAIISNGGGGGSSVDPVPKAIIKITNISTDSGLNNNDFITNVQNITINGTLSEPLTADDRAQISIDGGVTWQDLVVDSNGQWTFDDTRTLTDGTYNYQVRVVDTAGQVGSTDSRDVTIDTTAPDATEHIIKITSISDDTGVNSEDFLTSDSSITIHGTISHPLPANEYAQISIDGGLLGLISPVII